jgi:membrane protease YdiL (CAAX protease family)
MTRATVARPLPRTIATIAKSRPQAHSPARSTPSDAVSSRASASSYFHRSETPLTNLLFLLPLLAAYELGTRQFVQNPIIAFSMIQHFFAVFFGPAAIYLPPIAVVGTLLGCHLVRRDPWRFRLSDLWKMAIESAALAIPLLLIWIAAGPYLARLPLYSTHLATPIALTGWAVPCIGAGIYEELIFRLIVLNLLSFLLIDLLQLRRNWAVAGIIIASAILFAAYHYLGSERFSTVTFVFRTIAGLYFAAVFLCRGFGITCGCHASYDLIVIGLRFLR